jgi:hypothetical protein
MFSFVFDYGFENVFCVFHVDVIRHVDFVAHELESLQLNKGGMLFGERILEDC